MTARDRTVILVVGLFAVLGAFWFLALAPKRKSAQALTTQIAEQSKRLEAAEMSAKAAEGARERYGRDYATVARLGKAVPVDDEVPSLVYQLETAAAKAKVDFRSMKLDSSSNTAPPAAAPPAAQAAEATKEQSGGGAKGGDSTSSSSTSTTAPAAGAATAPATSAAVATLPPGASVGPAGFPTMPFSFAFDGTFFGMESFLRELNRFTRTEPDRIDVRGRLLTVNGISLVAGRDGYPNVKASISATAYLLPAEQGLTAGATPAAPGAAVPTAGATATPASNPGAPAAPTPAATATGAKP